MCLFVTFTEQNIQLITLISDLNKHLMVCVITPWNPVYTFVSFSGVAQRIQTFDLPVALPLYRKFLVLIVFILCLFVALKTKLFVWLIVFNVTFNNISVIISYISWRSVLSVKDIGYLEKKHLPVASHWQNLSHNVVSSTPRHERVRTHNLSGHRH